MGLVTLMNETLVKNQAHWAIKVSQANSAQETKLIRLLGQNTYFTMSMQENQEQEICYEIIVQSTPGAHGNRQMRVKLTVM